ncbi:MAG: hypothetical protein AAB890_01975 [Patescibacteria group bacterium]
MRKNLLSIVVLTVVLIVAGCGGPPLTIKETGENITQLLIYRSVAASSDPSLMILAEEINFDDNKRIITIKGLKNIVGDGGWYFYNEWVVPEISVQDNNLIISIPKDAPYYFYIDEQCHYLSGVK